MTFEKLLRDLDSRNVLIDQLNDEINILKRHIGRSLGITENLDGNIDKYFDQTALTILI